jgi:hypothetical protein
MDDDQQKLLPCLALWLGIVGVFLALFSIVLWFPWYWPTIAIRASSDSVEPSAGMPISFSIENTGILDAHASKYRCYFAHLKSAVLVLNDDNTNELPVADPLLPHDPIEISCQRVGIPALEADVAILVSFRPSFDWRRSSACARYALRKNAADQLAWFRKTSAPCKDLAACLYRRDADNLKYRDAMRQFMKQQRAGQTIEWPKPPKLTSCLPKE